jgi:hypothetical protein
VKSLLIAAALLQVAQVSAPATSSPVPLKIITDVKASRMCDTLKNNVFQAIQGLQANDNLVATGGMMMVKMRHDDIADPGVGGGQGSVGGAAWGQGITSENGGAGAASKMDDVQLGSITHSLAVNLGHLESLLADAQRFPADPKTDGEKDLALLKSRLEAVIAKQKVALDILSQTYDSNELADLLSVGSPIQLISSDSRGHTATRLTMPEYLQLARKVTALKEDDVTPAIEPIVAACK